ncbi:hypothetical protein [Salinigranum salinum]|uniref:hypothetical protein n=1 Tax=Salinigranum salinum TaxID=1364937 RepID=UPI001864A923|nr:hypothetical protein [Salinigranum salinum]
MTGEAQAQSRSPVVWSVPIGGELRKYSIGAESVLTGNSDGRIRALETTTGEQKWELNVDSGVRYGGLAQTDRYIMAITEDNRVQFINKQRDGDRLSLPLSGKLSGVDTKDGSICVGTDKLVRLFDLPPEGETLDSWREQTRLERWRSESGNFGPPVVWTNRGLLVSGSEDNGNVVNILSTDNGLPVDEPSNNNGALGSYRKGYDLHSVAQSEDYVAIHGFRNSLAGRRSVSDSVITVVNTSIGESRFRQYTKNAMSVGMNNDFVIYDNRDSGGITVRSHGTYEEVQPLQGKLYPKGIHTEPERTFLSKKTSSGTTIQSLTHPNSRLSFGELDAELPFKLWYIRGKDELIFGFDKSNSRLIALSKTGDPCDTPGGCTPTSTDRFTTTTTRDGGGQGGDDGNGGNDGNDGDDGTQEDEEGLYMNLPFLGKARLDTVGSIASIVGLLVSVFPLWWLIEKASTSSERTE